MLLHNNEEEYDADQLLPGLVLFMKVQLLLIQRSTGKHLDYHD